MPLPPGPSLCDNFNKLFLLPGMTTGITLLGCTSNFLEYLSTKDFLKCGKTLGFIWEIDLPNAEMSKLSICEVVQGITMPEDSHSWIVTCPDQYEKASAGGSLCLPFCHKRSSIRVKTFVHSDTAIHSGCTIITNDSKIILGESSGNRCLTMNFT